MEYESTARPILTMEDLKAAQNAGALIQFTACGPGRDWGRGDTYDMPSHGLGSGGWIDVDDPAATIGREWRETGRLLRAWYPLPDDKETAE